MSTPKSKSPLEEALGGVPTQFRTRLIDSYNELKRRHSERNPDATGLSVGKFCEVALRLLQSAVLGTHTPFGTKIGNFPDECRNLIASPAAKVPESIRVVIPRALSFLYTMRNKRGIGHAAGDIDANLIDLATMVRLSDWIVCELIRVYHAMPLEDAQELLDSLAARNLPDVWEVAGKKRVLRPGLTAKQKALLLLYSEPKYAVLVEDLLSWVEYADLSSLRKDVLKPLHKDRLIEYDKDAQSVHLSPIGVKEVEEVILAATSG